jgi:tRNA pseudouridine38-40 synthase
VPLYLVAVIYDGSEFAGWAKQPQQITIQGCIEKILFKIFQQKVNILATSRTDKGVHALDQKFTFRLNLSLSPQRLEQILTNSLKKYVAVKKIYQIKTPFHPIKDVLRKEYRYYINTGEYNHFFNFSHVRQKDKISTVRTIEKIRC